MNNAGDVGRYSRHLFPKLQAMTYATRFTVPVGERVRWMYGCIVIMCPGRDRVKSLRLGASLSAFETSAACAGNVQDQSNRGKSASGSCDHRMRSFEALVKWGVRGTS